MAVSAAELLKEADRLKAKYGNSINHIIAAEAVLAERERCAEVAETLLRYADTTSHADEVISKAIREAR